MIISNSTQVPDVIIDQVIPTLKPGAVRVLLVILRFTYGWHKEADQISFRQLEKAAGISRPAVSEGVQDLESRGIIQIRRGVKGKGANEYGLNIDISTGQLVNKLDQLKKLTSKVGSKESLLSQIHSKDRRVLLRNTPSVRKATKKALDPDPRVKDLINTFCEKFQAKTGKSYVPFWAKEGTLLKSLLTAGQEPDAIYHVMDLYFADAFAAKGGFQIGTFCSQFNRLQSAQPNATKGGLTRVVATPGKYDRFK